MVSPSHSSPNHAVDHSGSRIGSSGGSGGSGGSSGGKIGLDGSAIYGLNGSTFKISIRTSEEGNL
jgi:hypothetical protein